MGGELCQAVMLEPTQKLWEVLAKEFLDKMPFSNCSGTLYGKHVRVTTKFRVKAFFIVLLGLVDPHLHFVAIYLEHFQGAHSRTNTV